MVLVENYVQDLLDSGMTTAQVGKKLGVTGAMVVQYRLKRGYKPSLRVAKFVYADTGIVLHPFAKESLEYETSIH